MIAFSGFAILIAGLVLYGQGATGFNFEQMMAGIVVMIIGASFLLAATLQALAL